LRILGPAGYGKTALLGAVLAAAKLGEPAWVALAARSFASQPRAPGATLRRLVGRFVESAEPRLRRYLSGLEFELTSASADSRRFELAFASFIEGLRLDHPCILAFDDAQWLDEQTVTALQALLETPAPHALVVALTVTSGYDEPVFSGVTTRVVNLWPLQEEISGRLVRTLWPEVADDVAAAVAERAGGVPFDLVALAQQAKADDARSADAVSGSAEVLLGDALDALAQDHLEFLQVCALLQDPIDLGIVERLIPDAAARDRLIARSGRFMLQDGPALRFRHSNIAGLIRERIPAPNVLRRKILAACLQAEARLPADFDRIATLAAELGDARTEFSALSSLASYAFAQGAYSGAIAAYERALSIGRPAKADHSRFYNQYGIALRLSERWAEARSVLEDAVHGGIRSEAPGLGPIVTALLWVIRMEVDVDAAWATYRELRPGLHDPDIVRDILAMGANLAAERGDEAAFEAIRQEAAALAAPPSRYALALFNLSEAILACRLGKFRDAARAIGEAGSHVDERQSVHRFSVECYATWIAIRERGGVGARVRFSWLERREDGSVANQTPPQAALLYAYELTTVLDLARGDWAEALAKIEALNLRNVRASRVRTHLLAIVAAIATLSGQESELAEVIDDDLNRLCQAALWDRALPLAYWRAASLHVTDPRAAAAIVESVRHRLDCVPDTMTFDFPLARALYARRAGDTELLGRLANPPAAPCSPWDEAQTLLAAGLAADALRAPDAAAKLLRAHSLFEKLDLPFFAAYAADACGKAAAQETQLLSALGAVSWRGDRGPRPRPPRIGSRSPAQPTLREREIAELVVEGLSNKEIGQRLTVSERTVEVHVANLFGKLNVRSRTQLVRVWLEVPKPAPAMRRGPFSDRARPARPLPPLPRGWAPTEG